MVGIAQLRHITRRRKRALWTAALCSASLVTGQVLFGDDQPASVPAAPSLIKQYLEAKNDLVSAPEDDDAPASSQPKLAVIAVEAVTNSETTADAGPAGSLRPAAVSAARDLPFVTAQPLPTNSDTQPALAPAAPVAKPVVAQTSAAVSAAKTPISNPHVKSSPSSAATQSTGDENLPPIVPAWAVPRPGTKKRAALPANQTEPAKAAEPSTTAPFSIQNPPAPLRIELGGGSTPSPATLPQSSSPPAAPTKRAESSPLQRLPQVIEMTPRPSGFQAATAAKSPAAKEPSLLPPAQAAMPMPLEIRNPHVSQASPASFEMPLAWPSTSPRHVDDTNPLR